MKALILGSGGREHALAWKLRQNPDLKKLYAWPGSAGMASCAEPVPGDTMDFKALADFCRERSVGLVIVGQEAPLAAGVADALRALGLGVFGPGKAAARLEASKSFAKSFMSRHRIPTPRYEVFSSFEKAKKALTHYALPVVIKADGLAAGKGVRVCASMEEANKTLEDYMVLKVLGESGRQVLLEECVMGEESTVMAFCDGRSMQLLPPSSDHKRLLNGNRGPNTGGMGAFAPTPEVTASMFQRIQSEILDRVLEGFAADSLEYRGILYCGLMLTSDGPKVLEFNVRFGDPEAQTVLPLLDNDLLELTLATVDGRLSQTQAAWRKGASVCVVLASEGYPERPILGRSITGLDALGSDMRDVMVFHAGTRYEDEIWKTSGGRVLGVTALGATLEEARRKAYDAAGRIHFAGAHLRTDIGLGRPVLQETVTDSKEK